MWIKRTSKKMLNNVKNIEEAEEFYRQLIPEIIERVKTADETAVHGIFDKVAKILGEPWNRIVQRKPLERSPHWNSNLNCLRKAKLKQEDEQSDHNYRSTGKYLIRK